MASPHVKPEPDQSFSNVPLPEIPHTQNQYDPASHDQAYVAPYQIRTMRQSFTPDPPTVEVHGAADNNHERARIARHWIQIDLPKYLDWRINPDAARVQGGIQLTQKITPSLEGLSPRMQSQDFTVRLCRADTLQAAAMLHSRWPTAKIAVLNHANPHVRGGGLLNGSLAQEEALCMRTTLYQSLTQRWYPLVIPDVIHSPDVLVCKGFDGTWTGYDLDEKDRFYVDVISAAAVNRPRCVTLQGRQVYVTQADHRTMVKGLKSILMAAVVANASRLVIGAWGCGAFGNPINQVASMIKTELMGASEDSPPDTNWANHGIKEVVIAIYDQDERRGFPVWNEFSRVFGPPQAPLPPGVQKINNVEVNYTVRAPPSALTSQDGNTRVPGLSQTQGAMAASQNPNLQDPWYTGVQHHPILTSSPSPRASSPLDHRTARSISLSDVSNDPSLPRNPARLLSESFDPNDILIQATPSVRNTSEQPSIAASHDPLTEVDDHSMPS